MRVMHVLASNRFSGAENVACQIIDMFKGTPGVGMAYCSPVGDIEKTLKERDIEFVSVDKLNRKNLVSAIRRYQPDIIHAHDMRASLVSACAAGNIPIIAHIHNNAFDSRKISLKSLGFLWAMKKIRHIFWVSQSAMTDYKFAKKVAAKSDVLSNIIDVDALRGRMKEDNNTYNYDIVFLGRLTYPKNPQRLLKIVGTVHEKLPDIKVAVIGTGELEAEVKSSAEAFGLMNNIEFLGFLSNPLKILHDAKLMLMTSRWEGLPMCALEAMALGVPIVSSGVDGLKDIIKNNETGYMSDSDNEMVDAIIKILGSDELRREMSERSIVVSLERNDIEKYKEFLTAHYCLCREEKI